MKIILSVIVFILILSVKVDATIWKVGVNQRYKKPSEVTNLVQDWDTVEIDEGIYFKDVTRWSRNNLVLMGMGNGAHLNAGQIAYGRKAIWVIAGNNTTVENIEFSNCEDPTGQDKNWAGIRQEGNGLTVRNCYFHNNSNGILGGGGATSDVVIEHTEFAHNGYGDGYSHNLYIGNIRSLTFRYNYSHHAKIGHELKSRATNNYICYNRIGNESDGTASREIDLPNGGVALLIGNQIQQGARSSNSSMIGYGLEGLSNPAPHKVYMVNNTIVNEIQGRGSFLSIQNGTEEFAAYNNFFVGYGNLLQGEAGSVISKNNITSPGVLAAGFVNYREYDYQLTSGSPAVDKGAIPDTTKGYKLVSEYEYVHPCSHRERVPNGAIDAGAYEYQTKVHSDNQIEKGDISGFQVVAYPNPYIDKITFKIESIVSGKGELKIYNLLGENIDIVYEGPIFANENRVFEYTPSSVLHNLIYIMRVDEEQQFGKILKKHN